MGEAMANPYHDIELDVRGMRALAHPVRLAILNRLQRHGPATATTLAPHVGASPSVTSWHLRHLASHGLVRDADGAGDGRQRWWRAAAHGIRINAITEAEVEAASALSAAMDQVEGDVAGRWHAETEPHLEPEWRRRAGRSSTRILVTPEELDHLGDAIEQLLAPYVLRKDEPADRNPPEARGVRFLSHTLPELEEES